MLMVMGTSTCHIMNGDELAEVPGMCGVVDGGIVPGLWGYEAGQSGVGDIFAWFVEQAVPPAYHEEARRRGVDLHTHLSELAGALRVGEHGLVVLDWHNGNRSILVDHELSGLIVGLTLATRPEHVYRALLEATAFGTRKIIEAFEGAGVPVRELIAAGGLIKNPVVMQIYADVTRRPHPPVRVGAGAGARVGDARGGGRRRAPRHPGRRGGDGLDPARRLRAGRGARRRLRRPLRPLLGAARPVRPQRAHAQPAPDCGAAHDRRAAPRRSARCTPSCRATGSWRGRAGTCRRASPART